MSTSQEAIKTTISICDAKMHKLNQNTITATIKMCMKINAHIKDCNIKLIEEKRKLKRMGQMRLQSKKYRQNLNRKGFH